MIDSYLSQHELLRQLTLAILGAVASALINWLARKESPEAWEQYKIEHPRAAGAIALLRAVGVDPAKLRDAALAIVAGKKLPPRGGQ